VVRITVISADIEFTGRLRELLTGQGFRVDILPHATRGIESLETEPTALVLLDETSPEEGGYEILRRLRTKNRVPVLMLLRWDNPEERIASLEAGADDCLGRPFHPKELVARVRSILRRSGAAPNSPSIEANGVAVDLTAREVFCEGKPVSVTTVEFDILVVLIRSAGRPVSRDELMSQLYHRKATPFDRSIDMHVSHLRRKFVSKPELIKTVRGEGYQFCLPGQEEAPRG
jgi:two-component system, OmpR family, response regulator CpxR